jgi:hypothetical protein
MALEPTQKQWSIEEIAGEILEYIAAHPNAADTLKGITEWWVSKQRSILNRKVVKEALEMLIDGGQIAGWRVLNGSMLYAAADLKSSRPAAAFRGAVRKAVSANPRPRHGMRPPGTIDFPVADEVPIRTISGSGRHHWPKRRKTPRCSRDS